MASRAAAEAAAGSELLTRYLIFETDEAAVAFDLVGTANARSADDALRGFYGEPPEDNDRFAAAVSENHFRVKPVAARVRVSFGEALKLNPPPAAEEPEQTTLA